MLLERERTVHSNSIGDLHGLDDLRPYGGILQDVQVAVCRALTQQGLITLLHGKHVELVLEVHVLRDELGRTLSDVLVRLLDHDLVLAVDGLRQLASLAVVVLVPRGQVLHRLGRRLALLEESFLAQGESGVALVAVPGPALAQWRSALLRVLVLMSYLLSRLLALGLTACLAAVPILQLRLTGVLG